MTSQVYYRKWRPSSFTDLAGQEHVAVTLREAIKQGRVSHSYLFCGPRGTGKTTTARVLAKAVNCLDPQAGNPCNACAICTSVNAGRFMDIIELDAASNRGIDEIREIRDRVNFSPVEGKRKVYIIDEAHMLTDQASNAFLKTLEEPPAHVIFVLCTTEANKILPTIISRCQRYDFRRLPAETIYHRLVEITVGEGVTAEPEALRLVARYATGSLRDAENLLEQLVVSYGDGVGLHQVEELLGLGHGDRWLELVKHLLMGNTSAALGVINQAAWDGTDLRQLHRQAQDLLRAALILEWGAADTLDLPDHVTGQIQELVSQMPSWRIIKALKIWGDVNMRYDAPSTLPLELAVVEICNEEAAPPVAAAPAPAAQRGSAPPVAGAQRREVAPPPSRPSAASAGAPPAPIAGAAPAAEPDPDQDLRSRWIAAVKALGRCKGKKYNLGALLRDCKSETVSLEGDTLTLPFTHRTNMERMQEELEDPNGRKMLSDAIEKFFGQAYGVRMTLISDNGEAGSGRSTQQSPLVRTALGMGARIVEEYSE
jgi:DNA polymerase III subunit gamma/tau